MAENVKNNSGNSSPQTPEQTDDNVLEVILDSYPSGFLPEEEGILQKFYAALAPVSGTKAETYKDALREQQEKGTQFVGFEADSDFDGLAKMVERALGKSLMDQCLVDEVVYHPETVLVVPRQGSPRFIPAPDYPAIAKANPWIEEKYRVRAFGRAAMNDRTKRFERFPITICSFEGTNLRDKDYLPNEEEIARQLYKIGTVVHEFGHYIYHNALTEAQRTAWQTMNSGTSPLTNYVARYDESDTWLGEQFGEAMRLMATNRMYLRTSRSDVFDFLNDSFPDMREIA